MLYSQLLRILRDVDRAGSIRKAAEDMNITSSALNRQIQRLEEEFGALLFERLPRGVRLNPAGEMLLHHLRGQQGDLERVRAQVADLSGIRRGHVTIACSQGLNPIFLPREIARYRAGHPAVTFAVRTRDRAAAEQELSAFTCDLALVFEPVHLADFEVLKVIAQPVCAILHRDHPLAARPELRLRDCLAGPHVVPSAEYGVRHILELATRGRSLRLAPVVEADSFEMMRHYVLHEMAVGFQIPIGLLPGGDPRLVVRELPARDLAPGMLILGQMRGRTLPVASAKFARQLTAALEEIESAPPLWQPSGPGPTPR